MDIQGLVIKAKVHPADPHDKEGAKLLLAPLAGQLPRMAKVWADSAYQGLKKWLKETLGWDLEVVKHWWTGLRWVWVPEGQEPPSLDIPAEFQVLPRRWVGERTLGWLGRNRQLSNAYEAYLPAILEVFGNRYPVPRKGSRGRRPKPKKGKLAATLWRLGFHQVNTSTIERHNNTSRQQDQRLTRKSLAFSRESRYHRWMRWLATRLYNFCRVD